MNANQDSNNDQISIGELSKETGVNSVTLRAWERRYGLLKPVRTPKGHRLYKQSDIEYVLTILSWLNKGIAVSKVKSLMQTQDQTINSDNYEGDDTWKQYSQEFYQAASQYNEHRIDAIFNKINKQYPFETLMKFCFTPLFESIDNSPEIDSVHYFLYKCLKQRLILMLLRLSKLNIKNSDSRPMVVIFSLTQNAMWKVWLAAIWLAEKDCIVHVFDEIESLEIANELTKKLNPTASLCFSQGRHKMMSKVVLDQYKAIDYMIGADFWLNKSELLTTNKSTQILYQPIDAAFKIVEANNKQLERK